MVYGQKSQPIFRTAHSFTFHTSLITLSLAAQEQSINFETGGDNKTYSSE